MSGAFDGLSLRLSVRLGFILASSTVWWAGAACSGGALPVRLAALYLV